MAVLPGGALAQAQKPDVSAQVVALRQRALAIYEADREKCLNPPDKTADYCAIARAELDSIRELDAEIAQAQREIAGYGGRGQ